MKKLSIVCLAVVMAVVFGYGSALAQPSSKATCSSGDLSVVPFASAAPIFTQTIHTAQNKDLFVDVSLECGLTTNTKVMSKALQRAISDAEAVVKVWVVVDPEFTEITVAEGTALVPVEGTGILAEPGKVTFARRYQALIAEFAGSLSIPEGMGWGDCLIPDPDDPNTTIIDPSCLTEEMLALILDTMTANSFNFLVNDLDAGDHTVVVWADLGINQSGDQFVDSEDELSDFAPSEIHTRAYLGNGSVTVESIRLVKGADITLE